MQGLICYSPRGAVVSSHCFKGVSLWCQSFPEKRWSVFWGKVAEVLFTLWSRILSFFAFLGWRTASIRCFGCLSHTRKTRQRTSLCNYSKAILMCMLCSVALRQDVTFKGFEAQGEYSAWPWDILCMWRKGFICTAYLMQLLVTHCFKGVSLWCQSFLKMGRRFFFSEGRLQKCWSLHEVGCFLVGQLQAWGALVVLASKMCQRTSLCDYCPKPHLIPSSAFSCAPCAQYHSRWDVAFKGFKNQGEYYAYLWDILCV